MSNDRISAVGTNISEKATMIWNAADSHMKPVCTSRPDLTLIISTSFLSGWGIGWDTTRETGC